LQQKGAATVILILDACRDNPFAVKGKRAIGMTRGLTRMDPAEGMFVLFSAGQGQSALDRLSDTDANPNSVFTRTLLVEMETPGQSMVQIAKKTQSKVRELAAKVDHVQVPAYYDQIVGDLYLSPEGATSAGSLAKLEEGGGESVLPPQEQKVAALQAPQPLTSFMRSNADWTVNVSLPEAATQFGYRIGDQGSFIDAGFIDALDQRTGSVCPRPISSCRQIRARPSSMSPGATGAASRPISSPSISIRKRRSPRARRNGLDRLPGLERRNARLFLAPHHLSLRDSGGAIWL
jgi:hypothetical protein